MTLSVYSHLKQQIIFGVVSSDRHTALLNTLKGLFRDDINSPRRLEQILTIGELLRVLEIRDLLSEDNLEPLKKIAQLLPNSSELMIKINNYEASHIPREFNVNYYAIQDTPRELNRKSAVDQMSNNTYLQISDEKRRRIFRTVTDEIGNSWRDLARYLGIRERDINNIDENHKTLGKKASQLIDTYLELKAEPDKLFFDLCDALEKARRKDLSNDIKKILLMNI